MDRLKDYRNAIQKVFQERAEQVRRIRERYPNAPDTPAETLAICDTQTDNYLLVTVGWKAQKRIHSILAHLRIVGDKIQVEWNGSEDLIEDLVELGIPESEFVAAWDNFEEDRSLLSGQL